jgi:autotransporter-associated beta strand protein
VRRIRLTAASTLVAIALALALAGLLAAAPAGAVSNNLDLSTRTLTVTVNGGDDDVTLRANGTHYEVVDASMTFSFLRSDVDSIIIDGSDQSNVDVMLDGSTTELAVPKLLRVKNVNASQNSGIRVQGQITISGLSGQDRVLELGDASGLPVILLHNATTFTLATPGTGTSSIAIFDGRLLGNQALSIQLPGDNTVVRQVAFGAPAGVPTSGDPSRLGSLAVSAGRATLPSTVATFGLQAWGATSLALPDADAVLRASRVTGTGAIGCELENASCTGTAPTLTVDVSEVRAGTDPGSSIGGVGSSQFGADAPEQLVELAKTGVGTLSFDVGGFRNRHRGGTTIEAGTLRIGNANALGTGSTTVGPAGTLELTGGVDVTGPNTPISFGLSGTITSTDEANVLRTPVTLLADAAINATSGLELSSYMAGGTHDLTVAGPVDLRGTVDTSGAVRVAPSTTWTTRTGLTTTGSLTVDGNLDVAPTGSAPYTTTLATARLDGSGAIRCGIAGDCGTVIAQVSDTTGATTFSGGFGGNAGTLGNLSVRKAGAGTLVLSGESRITGNTIVAAGRLHTTATASIGSGGGTVTVEAGASLSGAGLVGGHGSTAGAGQSVAGTLDLDGLAGPETMSTVQLDLIGGTLEVGVDGVGAHSQLQVSDSVFLTASPTLRARAGASMPDGTTVVIVRKTHAAPVDGIFAGLAEGATLAPSSGTGTFRITYLGGDGNDIALTWIAPSPAAGSSSGSAADAATTAARAVLATSPRLAGGALVSAVTVNGPGRIVQSAILPRARAATLACRTTRAVTQAGTYRLACRLSPRARAALARGSLRLTLVTTFTPTGGKPIATRATTTLGRGRALLGR